VSGTNECFHGWHTTGRLRLVVEDQQTMFAGIIGGPPTLAPIEFCLFCGAIRLPPKTLETINDALGAK
jgi:hypothetical protein